MEYVIIYWKDSKLGFGDILCFLRSGDLDRDFSFAFRRLRGMTSSTHFFCKNSQVRKSGRIFVEPFINSISNSKTESKAYQRAKICFEAKFFTSFWSISLANLQSMGKRNFWFKTSAWNFCMHKTMANTSFFTVE